MGFPLPRAMGNRLCPKSINLAHKAAFTKAKLSVNRGNSLARKIAFERKTRALNQILKYRNKTVNFIVSLIALFFRPARKPLWWGNKLKGFFIRVIKTKE